MSDLARPLDEADDLWQSLIDSLHDARFGPSSRAGQQLLSDLRTTVGARASAIQRDDVLHLLRFLVAGYRNCVDNSPTHPHLVRWLDPWTGWGIDNPDCLYLFCPVAHDGVYVLRGTRGTARFLDIQVNWGHWSANDSGLVSSISSDEIDVAADGTFELSLSAEPRPGNWLHLGPTSSFILIRQYFSDWDRERPGRFLIDREGAAYPPAPSDEQDTALQLERLTAWMTTGLESWDRRALDRLQGGRHAFGPFHTTSQGLQGQAYGSAGYVCGIEEALLLRFRPPESRYWGLTLNGAHGQTLDYVNHQISLNDSQAAATDDGEVVAVIAHGDPGTPNWLDAQGHAVGTVTMRYLLPRQPPEPPRIERVPLARVGALLPPMPRPISSAERSRLLHRRRQAVLTRWSE